eukprot:m.38935 g.38935  ORF g.38935 m.38935 type:complete len:440 (+) comp11222_c1_seq2:125-1444(+)
MGNKPTSSSKVDTQRQPSAVTKPGSVTVQYDVMLSFAAKDLSLAAKIADQMRDGGLKVWYDDSKEFLKNGRAILESKAFVLLLTESSAESKHCKDDIALAFISNKPIVPVALQDLKKISEKMDFGLKLTLRPMKVLELDIKGSDADEQFQAVLGQIADESSTTDTQETGLMNKTTRIKLDKERQTAEDAFAGTGDFWQRHFATCDSVDWDEFCAVFSKDYQQDIAEVFGTGEEDREQLFKLLKQRLFHGKVVLDKSRYYEVCNRYGGEMAAFWEIVQTLAMEENSIREVFDMSSSVRLAAVENLANIQSASVIGALRRLLTDKDANVRAIACVSLGRVSRATAETPVAIKDQLRRAELQMIAVGLKDPDRLVREASAMALANLGSTDGIPGIVHLWRNDAISNVRAAALVALEKIGGPEAQSAMHMTQVLMEEIGNLQN